MLRVSLRTLSALTLLYAGGAVAEEPSGPVSDVISLDAIVVTANKRDQEIDKLDGAVSVATQKDLADAGVKTVGDLGKVFPGVVIRTRGNRVYSNFTIRGQYSPDFYNPTVQIYVDGVPQDFSVFAQEIIDVERVELLRGPQGTLYGRNAYGGVINIISKQPRENRLVTSTTVTNRSIGGTAAATAAIVPDSFFVDLAIRRLKDTGHIDDADTGKDNIDDTNAYTTAAKLRFAPSNGPFDATIAYTYDKVRTNEELYLFDQFVDKRRFFSSVQPINLLDRRAHTGSLNWNYTWDDLRLTSISAYQDVRYDREIFGSSTPEATKKYSQELRLAYDGAGPLSGVTGIYLQDDDFVREVVGFSKNQVDGQSAAVFGEGTYQLTEKLSVTAGLRYSYDKAAIKFAAPTFSFESSDHWESFQPKASVGYQVTDNTRVYALVSRGYKPGGFNHTVASRDDVTPYDEETSTNYEIGLKTLLFEETLSASIAAFHIPSKNKQIYVGVVPTQVIRNVGEASSQGIEVEATWQPFEELTLAGTAMVGRSEIDSFIDPISSADFSGNKVPFAPDVTANLTAKYVVDQTTLPGQVSLHGAMHYVGKTFFNEANTLSQSGYTTFDAAIDLAMDNGFTFKVFGQNLGNKIYRTSSFNVGGVISNIGPGRVIGATVEVSF